NAEVAAAVGWPRRSGRQCSGAQGRIGCRGRQCWHGGCRCGGSGGWTQRRPTEERVSPDRLAQGATTCEQKQAEGERREPRDRQETKGRHPLFVLGLGPFVS